MFDYKSAMEAGHKFNEIVAMRLKEFGVMADDPSTFPYDDLIVDTVSGYEAKEPKPIAYVMVSQKTGGMFVIPTAFSKSWRVERKYDRDRKHEDDFYLTNKRFGRPFSQLVSKLKEIA